MEQVTKCVNCGMYFPIKDNECFDEQKNILIWRCPFEGCEHKNPVDKFRVYSIIWMPSDNAHK